MLKFTESHVSYFDRVTNDRVARQTLRSFAAELGELDPPMAQRLLDFANAEDLSAFHRIVALTQVAAYQRALTCILLATGRDATADENFAYLMSDPFLSGNAKARHLILSANAALGGR